MTPEDRELLQALRRQQADLQRTLARLDHQLGELEARTGTEPVEKAVSVPPPVLPPPIPAFLMHYAEPPPIPPVAFPPLPVVAIEPVLPELPPVPKPSFEFQLGRWLTALGAVFGVILLTLVLSWYHSAIYRLLGPAGILGLSAAASIGAGILGERLGRRDGAVRFVGQMITAMALVWLYLTFYAACSSETLRIIKSPFWGGLLLLSWSAYVLYLSERKQSQTLALFAITLAYFSSAINPLGHFTMGADLILALSAVILLLRNGWTALSYFSLVGTYLILLRRLIIDENGGFIFDSSRMLPFWPYAIYLIGAWLLFTAPVVLFTAPDFRGGKRLGFLSLNNGLVAGLLLLSANLAGYGHGFMGWLLLVAGAVLLITSRVVGWARIEPEKLMAAYAGQGLALVTAGIMAVYTGITRGFLLLFETFFLGLAGYLSRDLVLTVATYFVGFFATLFVIWEVGYNAHHPWLLGFGGATVMLLNAWWARSEVRLNARDTIILSASYYCALALGLIFTAMCTALSENALPPALAFVALGLTFLIYFVEIYELPPIAQTLLVAAQALVLFPMESGVEMPWWTTAGVTIVTLIMITWWTRQRVTRTGDWIGILTFIYALALLGLTYETVRPWVSAQGWMIAASFLSVAFLLWGAFTRVWPIAAVGQLFLAVAVYHFFLPHNDFSAFPWVWWAAAVPLIVTFSTARAAHAWLRTSPGITESLHASLEAIAYVYQIVSLAMLIRWIDARVPVPDEIAVFLLLGTLMLDYNVRHPGSFGVRCSFVLSAIGTLLYLDHLGIDPRAVCTTFNGLAFLGLLLQPALLRRTDKPLVTPGEDWALLLGSVAMGLFFVTFWIATRGNPSYLTLSWALYALFLYLFSLLTGETRLRWCGLAVLVISIVRVFLVDFWGLSNGYRILTFFVLMLICLGFGYHNLRSSDRAKK